MSSFSRCNFCKINHDRGIAHLYAQSHKNKLKFILKKYKLKIKNAKIVAKEPIVKPELWEKERQFWCHFCERNFKSHLHYDEITIVSFKLLEHVSSEEHFEKMQLFWRKQRLRDQKNEWFSISRDAFNEFEGKSYGLVKNLIAEKEQVFKEKTERLKIVEQQRADVAQSSSEAGRRTTWKERTSSDKHQEIRPSFNDYVEHLVYERKKKLPSWLPSLESLWSKKKMERRKWSSYKQRKYSSSIYTDKSSNHSDSGAAAQTYEHLKNTDGSYSAVGHTSEYTGNTASGYSAEGHTSEYTRNTASGYSTEGHTSEYTRNTASGHSAEGHTHTSHEAHKSCNSISETGHQQADSGVNYTSGYVRKKHCGNGSIGRIKISDNLL